MSANLSKNKNLDKQLLPGLTTLGVDKSFKKSIFPFYYNDISSLKKILIKKNDIGIIIMEPMRFIKPKMDFLRNIRKIANRRKIVLIFDEITSGFHDNLGGYHLKLGVKPDMAIFGKAMANGFPISAIIGKKKIMQNANKSFISSTMWTEQIGFVAANATIEKLKKFKVNQKNVRIGKRIKNIWKNAANRYGVNIEVGGLDSLPSFKFNYKNKDAITTFMTREMLKFNILANTAPAVTYAYTNKILNIYENALNKVFKLISYYIKNNNIIPINKKDIKLSNFGRLTG